MEIRIDKIIYPGKSLSRQKGKVILTNEGLPGEKVEIEILKEKKNYIEAETKQILEKSAGRALPRCSHYKICSQYQYIGYSAQLELKRQQVAEMFSHNLGMDLNRFQITRSPQIWNYRNKAHMHIIWEGNTPYLAYHIQKQYREYRKIDKCFLVSKNINLFLDRFIEQIKTNKLSAVKEIVVRDNCKKDLLLSLYIKGAERMGNLEKALNHLRMEFSLTGCAIFSNKKIIHIYGEDHLTEKAGGIDYFIGFSSFFQINGEMLKVILGDLNNSISLSGAETIADIYCGVGTFSIPFAKKAKKVYGIETDLANIKFLKKNVKENNINNFSIQKGASEKFIGKILRNKIDMLILDPPRKGLGDNVCKEIIKEQAKDIFYISCNPATLIRDLKILRAKYNIKKVSIYDFFPHTPHIETLTVLSGK